MARENDAGGYDVGFLRDGDLVPYPAGESPYGGNFCVSTDDENVPDGKIIGLQVAGTRWVNPNQCAQTALEAEREQLDSTHLRPEGDSGGPCGTPPCEHPSEGRGDDSGTGKIQVTWEDCETVRVTGSDGGLDDIVVHAMRCFPGDGPCPDDNLGVTVEDSELPLTIDDRYLEIDGDEVPYYIWAIELLGDVEQDFFQKADDLDCSFGGPVAIDSCTEITEPGAYELVTDLQPEDGAACLKILAGNVTVDGNGHTIDGSALSDSTDSTGILIDTSGESGDGAVELRDVRVRNWTDGVSLIQAAFLSIEEATIRDNDHAIDAESGNDFELQRVLLKGNGAVADGFWEFGQVEIRESEIRENGDGLVVYDGTLEIHSSEIADNGVAGVRFSDMGPGVTIADTIVRGNAGEGISYRFTSPDLQNVTLADNEGLELDQGPVSALTGSSLTVGDSPTLEITEVSKPMSLDEVDRDALPALPTSAAAAGAGLDLALDEGTIEARFAFDAGDTDQVELWRHDGTDWERVEDATVVDSSIQATLSRDGIYAPVVVG